MGANYSIEILAPVHEKASFDCGIMQLNDFLKKRASQQAKKRVGTTYVLIESGLLTVIGYYTLASASIPFDLLPTNIAKKFPSYQYMPATLLGRLAVDVQHQGKNLGEILLYDALKRSFDLSQKIGSMAVAVDAINDKAVLFYKKYGFM